MLSLLNLLFISFKSHRLQYKRLLYFKNLILKKFRYEVVNIKSNIYIRRDNQCSSLQSGVENLCCSEQDSVGIPSLKINERLIPAHLSMLDEKECYSSHLSSGWHGFSPGFPSGYVLVLVKPMPSLAQMRRVLHSARTKIVDTVFCCNA